jgi:CDP-diacylglycerol--glycerol-3-phosphate 3-phosphatidyltransferase
MWCISLQGFFMLEGLKPGYNAVLRPLGLLCIRLRIKPNYVTVAGFIAFCAAGYLTAIDRWFAAAVLVGAGACMDGLDGLIAREGNMKSTFGAVFDSTMDRLTEIALFIGIFFWYQRHPDILASFICIAGVCGSLMVSYIRARCEGAGLVCTEGFFQRPERIIVLVTCLVFGPKVMFFGLSALSALVWVTSVQRLIVAYRAAARKDAENSSVLQ